MCACAYHWGGCRYHERQGFALGSSSSSSACSFMAAGLWCLCSYPLLAILESGLPWMTPPFEHPCAQVGRPSVPQAFHRHIARMPHKLCPCPLFHLVLNLCAQLPSVSASRDQALLRATEMAGESKSPRSHQVKKLPRLIAKSREHFQG